MNRPIVDVCMQQPTRRFLELPFFESLRRWARQDTIPDIPLSTTVETMDQAGVAVGLLAAWWGPQGPLIDNDEVAWWVREHPGRLLGIGSVDLHRPMDAVRELRRCVRERGFRGLRIVPWLWGLPPDDRRYYPLYAECIELDIPFCLQVATPALSRPPSPVARYRTSRTSRWRPENRALYRTLSTGLTTADRALFRSPRRSP